MHDNPEHNKDVSAAVLRDGDMQVALLGYGATTQGWWYKDVPLILGYDDPNAYLTDRNYLGAIVGRVANRIGKARFDLGGDRFELTANEGRNLLHGGAAGLSFQHWNLEQLSPCEALLGFVSLDGEGGFPGEVRIEVRVKLDCPRLIYSISAWPDRPTPISIAQHNYYTLGSADGISGHRLTLPSGRYLDLDDQGIATGCIVNAAQAGLSFATPKAIENALVDIDHYFVFDQPTNPNRPIAKVLSESGLALNVYSDQAGAQVYTGTHLTEPFFSQAGLCIEPSGFPNAPNIATFPSMICTPEQPYRQTLVLEIAEESE